MTTPVAATIQPEAMTGMTAEGTPITAGAEIVSQNRWSCVSCRNRKIKCDRKSPCGNCTRSKIECVASSSSRMSRKPRRRPEDALIERLARLEGIIDVLKQQGQVEIDDGMSVFLGSPREAQRFYRRLKALGVTGSANDPLRGRGHGERPPSTTEDSNHLPLEHRLGKLILHQEGTRYINDSFWANIDQEAKDIRTILIDPSESEDEPPLDDQPQDLAFGRGFIFGLSSHNVNLTTLHPAHELVPRMWAIFKTNVDPLVKILHLPTIEPVVLRARDCSDGVSRGTEALMFAIYYSVVTSLTSTDCVAELGEDKGTLLARYRFATEQALARSNFLESAELVVLQSFTIFLAVLRRNNSAAAIWALTGLAVRIAQAIGLHRDGTHFGLAPFEAEMRRRLWWQVCLLDARASEDHGRDATIVDAHFDARMPLNINDADLSPQMVEPPEGRVGFTEMTICLVGFELANIFRRIIHEPIRTTRSDKLVSSFESLDDDEKEKWILGCHQRLGETYLANGDLTVPPIWAAATLTHLVMSKIWLMAYHPFQQPRNQNNLSQRIRDKLFLVSVESIEYANQLDNDPRTRKWSWLFATYFQWHALAFLLSELCHCTQGQFVERAWRAMEELVRTRFGDTQSDPRRAIRWHAMKRLMLKARQARDQTVREEQRVQLPDGAHYGASYPAIDFLLGWTNSARATQAQPVFRIPDQRFPLTYATSSQTTPGNASYASEGDMYMFYNMDFDWTLMDIDQPFLAPPLSQMQQSIDPLSLELGSPPRDMI
ncbi:hypothetical protein B0T11DRAFT_128981 [Plectosphaerella cucumerina]|uniref:Zn(2)-C6 fungal-type domain-containing protein n=1 Tax=Plectosphaerella cucumerina TaxID=40658 RepID=A0A8K0TFT5_9PEZI|nr:hypothetical protein B0T11DRAFT_128981 [Plectosphaerella cucumerina]